MFRYWLLIAFFLTPMLLRADPSVERLVMATYKISNDASTATSLAIRHKKNTYLVTANHVLDSMKGDYCVLVSRAKSPDGGFQRQEVDLAIRRKGTALWLKHAEHDLAVLRLPETIQIEALPLEVLSADPAMSTGDAIRLATFPERFESNGAGFAIVRGGMVCSYPIKPLNLHPTFLLDVTSFSGDSGAPVMLSGTAVTGGLPEIVGIVSGQHRITETVKESKYVERQVHYPLGLSFAVHASYARTMIEEDE